MRRPLSSATVVPIVDPIITVWDNGKSTEVPLSRLDSSSVHGLKAEEALHEVQERESMLRLREARLQKQRQEYLAATSMAASVSPSNSEVKKVSTISSALEGVSDPYVVFKIRQ